MGVSPFTWALGTFIMAWIESHQTLDNHPKLIKAFTLLKVNKATMIGHLHLFWHWCLDYAPSGNISKYSDEQIAIASCWDGNAKDYVTVLREAGFIDKSTVHDWDEFTLHYNLTLEKRERQRDQVRERVKRWRNAKVTHSNCHVTQCNSPTIPNQTIPNQTIPNQTTKRYTFSIPTSDEVTKFAKTIDFELDGHAFCDFYESKGWKIGNSPMKSWQAAVRTWKRKHQEDRNGTKASQHVRLSNTDPEREKVYET